METLVPSAVDIHVFHRDSGRILFLLLHRAPNVRYAGLWRMVAGKIEKDETAVNAAIRELREETGLQPMNLWSLDYLHTFYDPIENIVRIVPTFAVEVADTAVTLSHEHDDYRWITYEQAMELLRWPGHRVGLLRTHEDIIAARDRGATFRIQTYA